MLERAQGPWRELLVPARFRAATVVWAIGIVLWVVAVGTGTVLLWRYKSTPGTASTPPATWPADSLVEMSRQRPTIVMLAHPRCPCTRASVGELAVLMTRLGARAAAHVLFLIPAGMPEGWEQTDLWRSAAAIPGVTVHADRNGVEAQRFHASTSGDTIVFDTAGRLRFHGGITDARGHYGESAGLERIVALVDGTAGGAVTPVFGCKLKDDRTQGE